MCRIIDPHWTRVRDEEYNKHVAMTAWPYWEDPAVSKSCDKDIRDNIICVILHTVTPQIDMYLC